MQRAPLLAPASALLLAIGAEQHGVGLAACLCAIAGALACSLHGTPWRKRIACATAAVVVLGVVLSIWRGHPPLIDAERATARYAALVSGDARVSESGLTATAVVIDGIGTVRVALREHVVPGERVLIRGRLEPFDEPRNPGEPSLREIERDDGFAGRLAAAHLIARDGIDAWDTRAWAARIRAVAARRIRGAVPEPEATMLAGILWGERGTLPDDIHDAFQATGTVHVLVTAGLHLGIVAAIAIWLLGLAGVHRTASSIIAIAIVIAYAWFSGAHLPSERAAAMIGVALIARAAGARSTSWNALAIAAIVVAVLWPASVVSASFAMSFSCVVAILLFADPLTTLLENVPMHERLREAIALTCATQLGTWPLTAAMFSTLAPYAIAANALVVPLIGIVLPLGLATLAFPILAPLATLSLLLIERITATVSAFPGATASIMQPSTAAIIGYDTLIVAAALTWRYRSARVACALLAAAFLVIAIPAIAPRPHELTITHLDVGQADAAVIRTPSDHVILIDTGGELERAGPQSNAERAGRRIVLAYLQRMGIRRIDLMILTHPHGDHSGGCRPILDSMPVGVLFDSGQIYGGRAYQDCIASARAHHVPIVVARRDMRWSSSDGVTLNILAPSLPYLADTGDDVNENSIVAMLRYRDFRELFMGDAGENSEARLRAFGDELHADVLKVGHHGSQYASTPAFIAAVHPRVAVISVGRHNTFGHPGASTLETLERARARIYGTDRCGALTLNVDAAIAITALPCEL